MKKQEQLFYLIKSLSKSEKRNIKKSFSINSNYLKLFDVMDGQNKYDNKEIRELFKNTKFINQLHVTKNYLIKQILKNLRNNNSETSVNIKLNHLLSEIELLYQKELFDQCRYLISKSENLAQEHEKYYYLNIILSWKRKVIMRQKNIFNDKKIISDIITSQRESLNTAITENDYWNLTIEQLENFGKSKEERKEFFRNPLLKNIDKAKTLRSKIHYHHIHYSNEVTINNPHKALEHLNALLLEIEKQPEKIMDDPSSYIATLNNKVSLLLNLKQYDLIPKILEIIREIPSKFDIRNRESISVKLNLRTYNIELEMYRDTKEYNKAEMLVEKVEHFLEINQKSITVDYLILFFYQFAYIYFMLGKIDKSLSWTNKLLQNDVAKIREDIYTYTRFLNLMIHFELRNNIVLKYAVDATRKNLRKKRSLLDFEKVLLRFFSKMSMSRKGEQRKLFSDLISELFAKTDQKKRMDVLDYIDFESWISDKLSKC